MVIGGDELAWRLPEFASTLPWPAVPIDSPPNVATPFRACTVVGQARQRECHVAVEGRVDIVE